MAPTARLPPKKDVALALLEQASMYVHLDPRAETVQVPAWFKKQPQLVLQVGLNMAVPIPDLHVDEQGLSCTLSFNRAPFLCMIPWPAIFALVGENGQAMVWAEDVPAEVAAQAQAQKAPEKPRSHLRSVGEPEAASAKPTEAALAPKAVDKKPVGAKASKASKAKPVAKAAKPVASKGTVAKLPAEQKPRSKKPAVLSAAPSKPEATRPAAQPAPAKKAEPPKPEAARTSTDASSKPKRELPPYLRVVK